MLVQLFSITKTFFDSVPTADSKSTVEEIHGLHESGESFATIGKRLCLIDSGLQCTTNVDQISKQNASLARKSGR